MNVIAEITEALIRLAELGTAQQSFVLAIGCIVVAVLALVLAIRALSRRRR